MQGAVLVQGASKHEGGTEGLEERCGVDADL